MIHPIKGLLNVAVMTVFGLKTIPQRRGSVFSAVVGIAGVVAVLVGVLSIAQGFRHAMTATGAADRAIVLRAGADTEMTSALDGTETRIIAEAPGIVTSDAGAWVSPELFVIVDLAKRTTGTDANVSFRGVGPGAFLVRSEVNIVAGRMFTWGRNEIIVGRGAAASFAGLDVGKKLKLGKNEWTVVGIFAADGGLAESEVWADVAILQPLYRRGNTYQVVMARLESADAFSTFKNALTTDPRLRVRVVRENDYYAEQSTMLSSVITGLGYFVAVLMGIGAIFGALNTMYTAVASRNAEIATLRALGFSRLPVVISVLLESIVLALVGGLLGAALSFIVLDGYRTATINWQSFSQVAFSFDVTPQLVTQGIVVAAIMGLLGGLFPAIRAARQNVAVALREK